MQVVSPYRVQRNRQQFSSIMELYEKNYILLRQMLPEVKDLPDYWVSRVPGHLDVHLWVLERAKFTTTLRMSYRFEGDSHRDTFEPDLTVRIYHDARSAEAMSAIVRGEPRRMRHASKLEWRWALNHFLYRWLRYSNHIGHHFKPKPTAVSWAQKSK